ncbi:hypothetical protein [Belliella aquatica]|uniref:DUF4105 domain-containing protein n=1 Tax=Belliella aquatica TaxID=1323734 RepID=A0ABQ1M0R1_9BACT|nr:hypothetical protein [Belliella aquatica]MCH7405716.1 hypothetical protein [Belliella aquatica]GGC31289.1 hypothetical protein GCM10010993_07770 [Belliella aquatica]
MKKIFLLLFFTAGIILSGFAQNKFPSQIWHKGKVVTVEGQVYTGLVLYDLENNIVQLQREGVETFGASNVSQFEIFDEVYGGVRIFYSLPYALATDYQTPVFFEVLTQGNDVALLCREYIANDNRGMGMYGSMMMNPMWGAPMGMGFRLAFNYYFFKDGEIQKYSQKKRDLMVFFDDREDEVKLFMRKNRLSHDKRGDLLRITAYYNQIK